MKTTPDVFLHPADEATAEQQSQLKSLAEAVYPPEISARWPGRHLEWAPAEWAVRISVAGQLVSYLGIVSRHARYEDRDVFLMGIGGVKTHPEHRRRGYAALGIRRAIEFFREQNNVAWALLVCDPQLMSYYGEFGWQEFRGTVMTQQHGNREPFDFNRVMLREVHEPVPTTGVLDLCGSPW